MTRHSGVAAYAAVTKASTWGTAAAATTGSRLQDVFISDSLGESILRRRGTGSGKSMAGGATRGLERPTVTIDGQVGFNNNFGLLLAQLLGTATVGSEITASQSDYKHTLSINDTPNSKYLSVAFEDTDGTVKEYPTCAMTQMVIRSTGIPGYLEYTATLVANKIEYSTAVNTNAALAAATLLDSRLVTAADVDDLWIDTSASGALASGDQFNITDFVLTLSRPQEARAELRGVAGLGAPYMTDLITATLELTLSGIDDHAFIAHHLAETFLKAAFSFEGDAIGTGSNRSLGLFVPQMQLLAHPEANLSGPGVNPGKYVFECSVADSNPTGMSFARPYAEIINTSSTAILA